MQWIVGSLAIVTGLVAVGVGLAVASRSVHAARRTRLRVASRTAGAVAGWGVWFLGGFSGMALGIRWLAAVSLWLAWTVAGVGLIGLGLRLIT
ncbi:MAG: hypothetical protein HYZ96_01220 [Candidatus Omnitrophica bacterium]|nr:hypothetical protein [Candidatus Omnitrophota bacterium]